MFHKDMVQISNTNFHLIYAFKSAETSATKHLIIFSFDMTTKEVIMTHTNGKAYKIRPKVQWENYITDEADKIEFINLMNYYFDKENNDFDSIDIVKKVQQNTNNRNDLIERLVSLGYTFITKPNDINDIEYILKNWKKFIKYHNNPLKYNAFMGYYLINKSHALARNIKQVIDMTVKIDRFINEKHLTSDDVKILYNYNFSDDEILNLRKGAINFLKKWSSQDKNINKEMAIFGKKAVMDKIIKIIRACSLLNCPIPTGNDWLTNYCNLKSICEQKKQSDMIEKNKEVDKTFSDYQLEIDLHFEDDNFEVLVPTHYAELVNEGECLNNCLGNHEWNYFLSTGERRVVFIRSKSNPTRPYIACDIMAVNNKIEQYLTYNNYSVNEPLAIEFKKKYQDYLNTLQKCRKSLSMPRNYNLYDSEWDIFD